MRRKKERSKQGQTNKQGKATHVHVCNEQYVAKNHQIRSQGSHYGRGFLGGGACSQTSVGKCASCHFLGGGACPQTSVGKCASCHFLGGGGMPPDFRRKVCFMSFSGRGGIPPDFRRKVCFMSFSERGGMLPQTSVGKCASCHFHCSKKNVPPHQVTCCMFTMSPPSNLLYVYNVNIQYMEFHMFS